MKVPCLEDSLNLRYIAQFIATDGKGMGMLDGKDEKSANYACEFCECNRNKDLVVEEIVNRDSITFRTTENDLKLKELAASVSKGSK